MEIIYKNYKMYPSDNVPGRFDMYAIKTRKKKDSEETYEVEDLIGYGLSIDVFLQKIVYLEIEEKNKESILTIKEYLKEFEKMKNEILVELKELLNIKI